MMPTTTMHRMRPRVREKILQWRPTSRPLRSCTAAVLFAIAFGACGGGGEPPTAPTPNPHGSLRTTIKTTGGDPDRDGYDLSVGSLVRQPLPPNGTIINVLPAGTHSIRVESVAENCSVSGSNPRTVTIPPGTLVDVAFEVVCLATGVEVTARTTGVEYAAGHSISLNSRWVGMVGANASLVISRLPPGTYTVSLGPPGDHCRISGSNPVTIEVKNRTVTPVSFDVACVAPTRAERIAYTDGSLMVTVNTDGTGATVLVPGHSPSWSPDGASLVFSDQYCDYYYYSCSGGIAVVQPETRNIQRLQNATGFGPAWAPTGDEIAFVDDHGRLAVTTLGAPGTVRLLATPGIQYLGKPSWSPDGQRIVFGCRFPADSDLCVINKDGTKFERLTSGPGFDWSPAWGRDGRIAFSSGVASLTRPDIVILDPDGRRTTIAVGNDPAWSRDGSKVVFSGSDGIFIVDSDGKNLKRLTTGPHVDPAWRP